MRNPRTTNPFNESSELYRGLDKEGLILRDYLAAGRTDLANERTFLAYVRTALALFAAGVTLVHFFDSAWLTFVGWAFVPIGLTTLVIGTIRCKRMRDRIQEMQKRSSQERCDPVR